MSREYHHVQHMESIVFARKSEGKTNKEIAKELGLSKVQLRNLITRYNRRKTIIPRRKGRPRTTPLTTVKALEQENRRLQMEVDLLRDFLQGIERK